jgi:hypothetical protein
LEHLVDQIGPDGFVLMGCSMEAPTPQAIPPATLQIIVTLKPGKISRQSLQPLKSPLPEVSERAQHTFSEHLRHHGWTQSSYAQI